jgi:NAD(P)-dependent dehydrogenase (short-subunit alcohol dehydrogenase family)
MKFDGRIALVTGAGGPMGKAIALRFAEEGARLVLADISATRLDAAAAAIRAAARASGDVASHRASVIVEAEAGALCDAAIGAFGRVDILVNVVGGIRAARLFEPVAEMSHQRWRDTMALNLDGTFHLTKRLAPLMQRARYGRIVNISSINMAGERGQADYAAAKAAIASLTRSLAMELAPDVTVNCIAPGIIRTSAIERLPAAEVERYRTMNLMKRLGEPREVANAALFVASDEASFITGEMLAVSGGVWPAL